MCKEISKQFQRLLQWLFQRLLKCCLILLILISIFAIIKMYLCAMLYLKKLLIDINDCNICFLVAGLALIILAIILTFGICCIIIKILKYEYAKECSVEKREEANALGNKKGNRSLENNNGGTKKEVKEEKKAKADNEEKEEKKAKTEKEVKEEKKAKADNEEKKEKVAKAAKEVKEETPKKTKEATAEEKTKRTKKADTETPPEENK